MRRGILPTVNCLLSTDSHGGLAQLARAPALQAGGHRFESDILHWEIWYSEESSVRPDSYRDRYSPLLLKGKKVGEV